MSTNENTNDSNSEDRVKHHDYTYNDIIEGYSISPDKAVFQIKAKVDDIAFVYLVHGAQRLTVPVAKLLKHFNYGSWEFSAELTEEMQLPQLSEVQIEHKHKILNALIFGQLAAEANDALKGTLDHNKYLENTLRKSNKELERQCNKDIQNVYGANPELLTNVFNTIEDVVKRIVKKLPHEMFFINLVFDEYEANPDKWQQRPVEMQKLNTEL